MASEFITGLVPGAGRFDWTVLRTVKGRLEKVGSGDCERGLEQSPGGLADAKGDVAVSVTSDQVLLRVVELPKTDEEEMRGMVELQVDKFAPFSIDNMIISHEVLAEKGDNCVVLAAAVKKSVVEGLGAELKGVGIKPARVDVDIMGRFQILRDDGRIIPEGRQVLVILDDAPALVVIQDSVPVAFCSFPGGADISRDELLSEIAGEAGYTLMSLELEHGSVGVSRLEVFTDSDLPASFLENLKKECGCEAHKESLKTLPPLSEGIARRAAARPGTRIDLTPASWREQEASQQQKKKTMMVSASFTAVWLLVVGGFYGYLVFQEASVRRLEAARDKWRGPADEVREMARRVRIIQQYMDRSDSALECLRETTELMPVGGIVLTSFNYKKGESLVIAGESDSRGDVLNYNARLNESKLFTQVVPGEIKILRGKHRFSFELVLPGGEG